MYRTLTLRITSHIPSVTMTGRAGRVKKTGSSYDGRRSSTEGLDIVNEVLMKERIKTVSSVTCHRTDYMLTAGSRSIHAKDEIRRAKKS